jgi:HEAT repeat protein
VPGLIRLAKEGGEIRKLAIVTLGRTKRTDAVAELADLLKHQDPGIRSATVLALGATQQREVISLLVKAIDSDKDEDVRSDAVSGLGRFRDSPDLVIPILAKIFGQSGGDKEYDLVEDRAIKSLAGFGRYGVRPLIELVANPMLSAAKKAKAIDEIRTLAFPSFDAKLRLREGDINPLISTLEKTLNNEESKVRISACHALGAFGSRAMAARPGLKTYIKNAKSWESVIGARALFEIDPRDTIAIESLTQSLASGDARTRRLAWAALRRPVVVEELIAALDDNDAGVRLRAVIALGKIRSSDAVPNLAKRLKDADESVRNAAVSALKEIRDSADPEAK